MTDMELDALFRRYLAQTDLTFQEPDELLVTVHFSQLVARGAKRLNDTFPIGQAYRLLIDKDQFKGDGL